MPTRTEECGFYVLIITLMITAWAAGLFLGYHIRDIRKVKQNVMQTIQGNTESECNR